jgi:hypothetical protein
MPKDWITDNMVACIAYADRLGALTRHPGGYWGAPKYERYGVWFSTSTVDALVKRGRLIYTAWKDGRKGRFPIEAKIAPLHVSDIEEARQVSAAFS